MTSTSITTYYLEMHARPERTVQSPRDGLTVLRVQHPSAAYYRFFYESVGSSYNWNRCRERSDEDLAALIDQPDIELYVLHVNGSPAGFAELNGCGTQEIELRYFGLFPEQIGRGLGPWFLQWMIDQVWSGNPERFWLHTCTRDHPAALPMYQQAGFVLYDETIDD